MVIRIIAGIAVAAAILLACSMGIAAERKRVNRILSGDETRWHPRN